MRTLIVFSIAFFTILSPIHSQKITYLLPDTINAGDSLTLGIDLEKGKINGFAKLEVYLPTGFTPKLEKQNGASMICNANMVKFIWIDIPTSNIIHIRIKMKTDSRLTGKKEFYGSFHYLVNGERKKQTMPLILTWVKNKITNEIPESLASIYRRNNTLSEPLPAANISETFYRVQLGAFSRKLPKEILSEFYEPVDKIKEEFQNGLYKYTIGDFSNREMAKQFCNDYGISGAFIVMYKNGKRQ